jgi:hypothetical protein
MHYVRIAENLDRRVTKSTVARNFEPVGSCTVQYGCTEIFLYCTDYVAYHISLYCTVRPCTRLFCPSIPNVSLHNTVPHQKGR